MSLHQPRSVTELRAATSRTRTARKPLLAPTPISISGTGQGFSSLFESYVGAPGFAAAHPTFAGHAIHYPFDDHAVQIYLRFAAKNVGIVLILDLGANRDLARVELYGNPLLPPIEDASGPVFNFGLPRSVAIGVAEEDFNEVDLHRRRERGAFYGDLIGSWRRSWTSHDFRALWGWSPIHLGPTFGRYILFAFERLPRLADHADGSPSWGIDLRRIVVYPFLEDVDHGPHVEHSIVSSRVESFSSASQYWQAYGENPAPGTHQSIFFDAGNNALLLPSSLSGMSDMSPVEGEVPFYASDPVPLDPAGPNKVVLITQVTTDEEPLLEGVHLVFRPSQHNGVYQGPKQPLSPDYLVRVHVTSDVEAAFSSTYAHPSWRLVVPEQRIPAATFDEWQLFFAEPVVARWVRLTVRLVAPPGVPSDLALPFVMHRLDVIRCRSWQLNAKPDEDIDVDSVLIRLRGERLADDYAFIDGEHGFGVTVEIQKQTGPFEKIRSFRTLLQLIEETQNRIFANSRRIDKPVQHFKEKTRTDATNQVEASQRIKGTSEACVDPEYGNFQITRAGTLTDYVKRPRNNLGGNQFTSLPATDVSGLVTTRTYDADLQAIAPPSVDFNNLTPEGLVEAFADWGAQLAAQGMPVSIGVGGNVGASFGLSFVASGSGSGGLSATVGTQLGGGVTKSIVLGNQGSVNRSESRTIESFQKQSTTIENQLKSDQSSRTKDKRDIVRHDLSKEVRRRGVEIQQAGAFEDLILITIPIGQRIEGGWREPTPNGQSTAPRSNECLRVRVSHVPRGVRMDVEFRGRIIPRERTS